MTIEEKAAAYDIIKKQRDAYIYFISHLIDDVRSGCFNDWDLTKEGVAENAEYARKDGLEFHMGPANGIKDYEETLRRFGLYHLGRLLRTANWVELQLNDVGWQPAEMVALYKKFDPKEIKDQIEEHRSFLKEDKPKELKNLVTSLFLLLSECPIAEGLPADEQSIYHDNIRYIIGQMFAHCGVDMTNNDQIMDAIHEYNPNIKLAEEPKK